MSTSVLPSPRTHVYSRENDFAFPVRAADVSGDNDKYTAPNDGLAVIMYKFDTYPYSQFGMSLNGVSIFPGQMFVGHGAVTPEWTEAGVFTLPMSKGDVLQVYFYSTYEIDKLNLRFLLSH